MVMTTTEIRRGPDPGRLRLLVLGIVLVVLVGGLVWKAHQGAGLPVLARSTASSTTVPPPDGVRSLGGVDDVTVVVEPRVGLLDGDLVEVRVTDLSNLPRATILQCAGYVSESNAAQVCDVLAVKGSSAGIPIRATEEQVVSVSRTLQLTTGPEAEFYDCAREPAGCVLAVGPYELPPRAVLVELEFRDG